MKVDTCRRNKQQVVTVKAEEAKTSELLEKRARYGDVLRKVATVVTR